MYMDNIKLFAKNQKDLEFNTNNKNIQSGYRNGIWHRKVSHVNNEKRKKTNNGRNQNV